MMREKDMTFPLEEPTADNRQIAQTMRGIFVALVNEGFTEDQALRLLGTMLEAGMRKNGD